MVGIAKLDSLAYTVAQTGFKGTPASMSPEQLKVPLRLVLRSHRTDRAVAMARASSPPWASLAHAAEGSNVLRRGASQESEGITTQTDCYSFATLMWDCATRGYAWQGLGLLHVRSAVLRLGALVCLFVCLRPASTIPVQVMTKVVVENMRPPTQPVRQARPN